MTRRALAVAVVALAALAVAPGAAVADHGGDGNYTVAFDTAGDRQPGSDAANSSFLVVNTVDISYLESFSVRYPEGVPSKCYQSDVEALGIDAGNDDPGSTIDSSMLLYAERTERTEHEVVVDFNDKDNPAGTSLELEAGDQFVLAVTNCVQHAESPGWYRVSTTFTGPDENGDGDPQSVTYRSHYFYVCDCESEAAARERLGPPPSEQSGGETTATPTPTPEPASTPANTRTPTPTPASTPTATPTPAPADTATPTPVPERTPTPTRAATATPTATATTTGAATATDTAEPTATPTPTRSATAAGPASPTDASGPGPGVPAALAALLAVAGLRGWSR